MLSKGEITLESEIWESDPTPLTYSVDYDEEIRFIIGILKSQKELILCDTLESKNHLISSRNEGMELIEKIVDGKNIEKKKYIWI